MAPSIIGEDLSVEGNVVSKGEVQVDGEIKGDIHSSSLVIGEKALIEGGVIADDVIVRGRVVGSIRGHRVTLQASSHVEGDIYHQSLAIEQGAYFEGKSRRSDDPMAKAKSSVTTKSDRMLMHPACELSDFFRLGCISIRYGIVGDAGSAVLLVLYVGGIY